MMALTLTSLQGDIHAALAAVADRAPYTFGLYLDEGTTANAQEEDLRAGKPVIVVSPVVNTDNPAYPRNGCELLVDASVVLRIRTSPGAMRLIAPEDYAKVIPALTGFAAAVVLDVGRGPGGRPMRPAAPRFGALVPEDSGTVAFHLEFVATVPVSLHLPPVQPPTP